MSRGLVWESYMKSAILLKIEDLDDVNVKLNIPSMLPLIEWTRVVKIRDERKY